MSEPKPTYTNELKPCPFCGKDGVFVNDDGYVDYASKEKVSCENPMCQDWTVSFPKEQWNTRPIENALRARIAELEHQLSRQYEK